MNIWQVESLGVVFSLLFVFFNAREKIICWFFGILSSAIYIYIFFSTSLYGDSILQFYYLIIAIYGWISWSSKRDNSPAIEVKSLPFSLISKWLILGVLLTPVFGYYLDSYTDSDVPYYDGATTVFSFIATWMMTRKIIQNWLLWVVVDIACTALYLYKGLYLTSILFVLYTLMAIYGYLEWRKHLNET